MSDAPDGTGDEAAAAAAAAAEAKAAAEGGEGGETPPAGEGGEGNGPKPYRPEGLSDEDLGANDQETIDKLFARAKGLRTKLSAGVPKTADEYGALEFSPEFAAEHGAALAPDDPTIQLVREMALEAGIPKDKFQAFVGGVLERGVKDGLIQPAYSLEAEFEKAGGKDAYQRNMTALDQRFDGLVAQGKLTEAQRAEAANFQATADGQGLFMALFGLARENGLQTDGNAGTPGGVTKESVKSEMRDPRYQRGTAEFDEQFAKEVDARAAKVFKGV